MKTTLKGYDSDLGRKFAEESSGLIFGRARSLPRKSEAQVSQDWIEEHGREPDAQQLHDAILRAARGAAGSGIGTAGTGPAPGVAAIGRAWRCCGRCRPLALQFAFRQAGEAGQFAEHLALQCAVRQGAP